jgi:hypothetical protein
VWADDVDSVGGISFDDMTSHLDIRGEEGDFNLHPGRAGRWTADI